MPIGKIEKACFCDLDGVRIYGATDVGRRKKENQDTFHTENLSWGPQPNQQIYLSVCDGHGDSGKHMAKLACASLLSELKVAYDHISETGAVARTQQIEQAFKETHKILEKSGEARVSGSTATIAWLFEDCAYFANVGDSTLALGTLQKDGTIKGEFRTIDHRPERPDERIRIESQGGRVAQARPFRPDAQPQGPFRLYQKDSEFPGLMVSRSLGDIFAHDCGGCELPYVCEYQWQRGDALLVLASDGLWDVCSAQEAVDSAVRYLDDGIDPAAELVRHAMYKESNDNICVVVCVLARAQRTGFCSLS